MSVIFGNKNEGSTVPNEPEQLILIVKTVRVIVNDPLSKIEHIRLRLKYDAFEQAISRLS